MLHKGSPVVAVHVAPHSIGLLISQIMTSGSCCGTLEASVTHDSWLGEAGDDFRAEKLYNALHKKVSSCSHASGKVRNRMRRLCVQKLQGGTLFLCWQLILSCALFSKKREKCSCREGQSLLQESCTVKRKSRTAAVAAAAVLKCGNCVCVLKI